MAMKFYLARANTEENCAVCISFPAVFAEIRNANYISSCSATEVRTHFSPSATTAKREHFPFIAFLLHLYFFLSFFFSYSSVQLSYTIIIIVRIVYFTFSAVAFLFAKLKAIAGGVRSKRKRRKLVCLLLLAAAGC